MTKNAEEYKDANDARESIFAELEHDSSFCNDGSGGRFGCPVCDWFVIGGRWSGQLATDIDWYEEALKICKKGPNEQYLTLADTENKENKKLLQKAWEQKGLSGLHPILRDNYNDFGYEDDCMLVTQEIYDKYLKEYEGQSESDNGDFFDLDGDPVSPDFINNKYICVVDYHS